MSTKIFYAFVLAVSDGIILWSRDLVGIPGSERHLVDAECIFGVYKGNTKIHLACITFITAKKWLEYFSKP